MPVPNDPSPPVPQPEAPFDTLSPVMYFTVARKAQHATNAAIANELGSHARHISKIISRAIHRLVAVGGLPPGSITEDIIRLYLRKHAPELFCTTVDDEREEVAS